MSTATQLPAAPIPVSLTLHKQSHNLEIVFDDGAVFFLAVELMRVYSPSAEVSGHGPGQEILQVGKSKVEMIGLEPVGNYAVKPIFSDGHASGIYTWAYLYRLGRDQAAMWNDYLRRLEAAGYPPGGSRD